MLSISLAFAEPVTGGSAGEMHLRPEAGASAL